MAKSNSELQKNKRAKEKALLDRIGAEKHTLIVSNALADALQLLGERHGVKEWQETVSTFKINLAAAPTEESTRFTTMPRPEFVITKKQSRQIDELAKTGIDS